MSSEILPVEAEQVLDACSEKACQLQCQWQGRGVALGLDGIDRLPRDAQYFGELALGQAAVLAQVAHPVLHPVKLTCQAGICQARFTCSAGMSVPPSGLGWTDGWPAWIDELEQMALAGRAGLAFGVPTALLQHAHHRGQVTGRRVAGWRCGFLIVS